MARFHLPFSNVEETVNTLRYAQRTRNIQNSAVRNVVATSQMSVAEAAALKRENEQLKQQLAQAQEQLKAAQLEFRTRDW